MNMNELLRVENFRLAFHGPNGRVPAVRGVDLTIRRGETVAIVGESGSGKTALCRCILMLHAAHAKIESGRILLCGKEVTAMDEAALNQVRGTDAAIVFQDPMSSLNPVFSIGTQIMDPLRFHQGMSKGEAHVRALELLTQVGIDHPELRMKQYPHHLSGGQRQRVAIAIALACDPALLIADEPTAALDADTQSKIMELLGAICRRRDRGVLFITHDLGLARDLADRILVMKEGQIVEEGTAESVFRAPQHSYTQALLRYATYGKSSSHYHGHVREEADPFAEQPVLVRVDNLTKNFHLSKTHSRAVLRDFSLNIRKGEIVGLVGPSGCGKSTLARCMMGIHTPTAGSIWYAPGCNNSMIFQDSASAFDPRMTIEEIIAEPLVIAGGYPRQERHRRVLEVMKQVELPASLMDRHPYDVSGGERQRAAIARALITDPDFLIADEPISSLDVSIQAQIIHLLKQLREERDLTILLIAHDLPMVLHISDRVLQM